MTGNDEKCQSTYELHCKDAFETLFTKFDRLDSSIRGNGKPGINARLAKLEDAEATRSKLVWLVVAAAVVQVVATVWAQIGG